MIPAPSPYSFDRQDWMKLTKTVEISPLNAKRAMKNLLHQKNPQFDTWPELNQKLVLYLKQHFGSKIKLPGQITQSFKALDGTQKLLVTFQDKLSVETVIIPSKNKTTLCLSSQVGCAMGCHFCHTGVQGLKRNLKVEEILCQVMLAHTQLAPRERITNIVFMGMGEPMHNWKEVKKSCEILQDTWAFGLGKNSICISSVGMEGARELSLSWPHFNLALSLHSAREEIRKKIVPMNARFSVQKLVSWGNDFSDLRKTETLYEMTIIHGLNDGSEEVEALVKILDPNRSKINLIPFNPWPGQNFLAPQTSALEFLDKNLRSHGFITTIRKTRGPDILGACGQLNSSYALKSGSCQQTI